MSPGRATGRGLDVQDTKAGRWLDVNSAAEELSVSTDALRKTAPYTVREVREVTPSEWDGWLRASPGGGHVLQSYWWGEFKRRFGWRPLRMVLERDGEVAGVGQFLALNTVPVPGILMYCSKGPWLPWEDGEAVRAFFEGVVDVVERAGAHTLKIEPEIPERRTDMKALLNDIGFQQARYALNFDTTITADLSPPEEELLARMRKSTRYGVRRAAREGVEVVEPEDFERAWETFYGWMKGTAERKSGFTIRRPRAYLHDMMRAMHDAGQGHLFLAVHEGAPLAGVFVFTFGEKYWFMHGASSTEKRSYTPNHLLQWELMRWAKRRGMRHYDMVGIPKPEDRNENDPYYGVYKFKIGFGGEVTDFLGCLDLPIKPARANAWHRFEPVYNRLYYKLKGNVFY
jgi:lipid II:glycine glycyltransferase (peptidoglycan interpeptide bridge formation enzyme)